MLGRKEFSTVLDSSNWIKNYIDKIIYMPSCPVVGQPDLGPYNSIIPISS